MWVWLFVTLALAAMVSLIARVFLAVRSPPEVRRSHIKWAAASAAAMAVFSIGSALVGGTGSSRRRWRFGNDVYGRNSQQAAMMMPGVAL